MASADPSVTCSANLVSKHLAHKDVDAYLLDTSEHLTIEIRNSPMRDLPSAEREPKALKVAQLAYKTYASRSSLKVIDVVFVVDKTESSALVSSRQYNAMNRYEFDVGELGAAAPIPATPAAP